MNIQKYIDLFEYKLRDEKDDTSGYYSFKVFEGDEYRKMSDVIHNAEVAEDTAYKFTVEALEAIDNMISGFEDDARKPEGTLLNDYLIEPEIVEQYSEAPIYNSELLDWISKGTSHIAWVEEAMDEYGGKNQEGKTDLIQSIRIGYSRAWEAHYFKVLEAVKN